MSDQTEPAFGSTLSRYLSQPVTMAVAVRTPADDLHAINNVGTVDGQVCLCAAIPAEDVFHVVLQLPDPLMARLRAALRLPELGDEDSTSELWTDELLLAALTHLITVYGTRVPARPIAKGGLASWQERRAKEMLALPTESPVTLAQVARELSLSPSYFARAFRQSTGVSPCCWHTAQRMEAAKALLLAGPIAIIEVAQRTGYAEQSSFTKAFRRHTGLSPSAWMRHNRR